jgi:DNA replication protein DnaC
VKHRTIELAGNAKLVFQF